MNGFFPNAVFGWCFVGALAGLLAIAAVIDLRHLIVPKWLTLTLLPLGVVLNLVRGGWLGAQGESAWALGGQSALMGVVDGLLFSLAGFALGFAAFFLIWLLRVCGGGDVKLYAAVGAWIGPYLAFLVLFLLLFVITGVLFIQLFARLLGGGSLAPRSRPARLPSGLLPRKAPRRLLTFSLPLAVTTLVVLLWSFRADLHLAPRAGAVPVHQGERHGS